MNNKYEEAIEAIKANYPPSNYTMLREGLNLAIEILEKQIPKKYSVTEYETFNGGRLGVGYVIICSICKKTVHEFEFCPHCGQKIDWADKE